MANNPANERISAREKLGFGLGDAACNIVFQMVLIFSAYFYTDVFGLAPAAMGTMFLIVRLVNSLSDPVMGAICDRTETRWGKFRPYLFWMSVPLAGVAVLAFITPDISPRAKIVYAYGTYFLLTMSYTAINVPYCALGAVITPNQRERVSLNGYRFFLVTAAGALVASVTLPLVELLGRGNDRLGFPLAMVLFGILSVGLFLACFALTKERVVQASPTTTDLWTDIRHLARNDQWLVVASLSFLLFVVLVVRDGTAIYYVQWVVGRPELVPAFLTGGMLSSMLGALSAGWLAERMSKVAAYSWLQLGLIALSILFYFVDARQVGLVFVLFALVQFVNQMASPFLWSMMADSVDYGEYRTAAGGALLGWMLAYFGYQNQADVQTATALHGICVMFSIVPAIGHAALFLTVRRYRLNDARNEEIRIELQRRGTGVDETI
jgi:GPH family glycoside/pentoside/hexuronide:cation symporter